MKHVDDQVLDALKLHVKQLPARRKLRPYDVVAELAELYAGARTRGYDLDDLVRALERHGIKLTRTTVRNYLSRARASRPRDNTTITPAASALTLTSRLHDAPVSHVSPNEAPAPPNDADPDVLAEAEATAIATASALSPESTTPPPATETSTTENSIAPALRRGHFQPKLDRDDI